MSPYDEVDLRLERLRKLWRELQKTPVASPKYDVLAKEIRAESDAYNALVQRQERAKKL